MTRTELEPATGRLNAMALVAVLGASVLASLDLFIVNLALPRIGEAMPGTSPQSLSWVLNGYTVAFAALLAPSGRIADRYGRRRVFGAGLAVFTAASLLAALAPTIEWLVAARIIQGVGASVIVPTSLALLLQAFPEALHKRMVSIWAASGSVAAAIGPALGGVLADLDWRLVFAVNVPIGIVVLVAARALPATPRIPGPTPDWLGSLALAASIGALVTLLSFWTEWTWHDPRFWAAAGLCVLAGAAFLRRSTRHRAPVVDLRVFRVASFSAAALGMVAFYTGFSMMLLGGSLWATNVWGWESALTGVCFILGPGTAVVAALAAGRLSIAAERLSVVGGALFVVSGIFWALTLTHADSSPVSFLAGLVLTGAGAGLAQTGFLAGGTRMLPREDYATGSGVLNTARQIGAALGVALLVLFIGSGHEAAAYLPIWLTLAATGAIATATGLPLLRTNKRGVAD